MNPPYTIHLHKKPPFLFCFICKHRKQCRHILVNEALCLGAFQRSLNGGFQFFLYMVVSGNPHQFYHSLPDLIGNIFFLGIAVLLTLDAGILPQVDFRGDLAAFSNRRVAIWKGFTPSGNRLLDASTIL